MLLIRVLVVVGVAVAVVAGLFIMGHYLDKDAARQPVASATPAASPSLTGLSCEVRPV